MKNISKIRIANLLLTRRCNLECSYCRISAEIDYLNKPDMYPSKSEYFKRERDTRFWCEFISNLYRHNSEIFLIIYGGEPFLRKDLAKIISHCNSIGVDYTIISSCNKDIQPLIDKFFKEVKGEVKGFTASVDPGFYLVQSEQDKDEVHKAIMGYDTLKRLYKASLIKDPVAEITISKYNLKYLEETVEKLSSEGITSDITLIDGAPTKYYDFSTVTNLENLVPKSEEIKEIFDRLKNSNYLIHMKDKLLDVIYENMPMNLDCKIDQDNNLHAITIDADGKLRLCLRIRGIWSPMYIDAISMLTKSGRIKKSVYKTIKDDKRYLCKGCIHSCYMMSQMSSKGIVTHDF